MQHIIASIFDDVCLETKPIRIPSKITFENSFFSGGSLRSQIIIHTFASFNAAFELVLF